jgi:nickel-dependent lactate racemase
MAAAAAVGAVLMIAGNVKSNLDQAKAEKQNAEAYRSQAEYARAVHKRKMDLLRRQQKDFAGKQQGMFAKAGISFSGSVIDVFTDTAIEQEKEMIAAENESNQEVSAYNFQAANSDSRARSLSNPATILLQSGGTALSAYGQSSRSAS